MGFGNFQVGTSCTPSMEAASVARLVSACVVKAMYYPEFDLLSAIMGICPSQVWRSICGGQDVMKLGLVQRIGDGRIPNAWNDNWLPGDHMLRLVCAILLTLLRWLQTLLLERREHEILVHWPHTSTPWTLKQCVKFRWTCESIGLLGMALREKWCFHGSVWL